MQRGFVWRLILDEDAAVYPPVRELSIVSAGGMRLVNMGQYSFMAMDAEGGCAVGFLGEEVLKDGQRFEKLVLGRLLCLTAEAVRWMDKSARRNNESPGPVELTR
jgi:hypothetical protein